MSEQKPQQLLRTCMETAVRLALIRHNIELDPDAATEEEIAADAAGACFGEECCDDKPIPEVSALLAELAQVKAERDAERDGWNAEKLGHADSITKWSSAERLCRELAVGLNSLLADQRVHLPVVPGSAGVRCLCYRCNALALLSRPEVVKLLEKEKV